MGDKPNVLTILGGSKDMVCIECTSGDGSYLQVAATTRTVVFDFDGQLPVSITRDQALALAEWLIGTSKE